MLDIIETRVRPATGRQTADAVKSRPDRAGDFGPRVGSTLGKCLLTADVSRGPGGSVFRATHLGLMIPVVVKVIPTPTAGDRGVTDHLKREAQLLAKLNHPNIIRVWDFQEDQGFAYLVLEQPTGPSLTELLRTEGRLRPDRALDLVAGVADALAAARRLGIIHGDINPDNILVEKDGSPKVAGLGQGGILRTRLDGPGPAPCSHPVYAAPEVFINPSDVDLRSDLYSLGVVLYHAVTGVTPYPPEAVPDVLLRRAYQPPPSPQAVVPDLGEDITTVITTLMARAPHDRYQDYEEFLDAVDSFAGAQGPASGAPVARGDSDDSDDPGGAEGRVDRPGAQAVNGASPVDRIFASAVESAKAGDKHAAAVLLRQVTELEPAHESAWMWLASVAPVPADALAALRTVLRLNPANQHAARGLPSALLQTGIAEARQGRNDSARQLLTEAAEKSPNAELVWLWLAAVTPNRDEAAKYLKKVLAINPANQHAVDGLQKYEAARAAAARKATPASWQCPFCGRRAVLARHPDDQPVALPSRCEGCGAAFSLSDVAAVASNPDVNLTVLRAAMKRWGETSERQPTAEVYRTLGIACLNCGEIEKAQAAFGNAARLAPDNQALAGESRAVREYRERSARARTPANATATTAMNPVLDPAPVPVSVKGNVLIVDDSPTVCKMVELTLKPVGFRVTAVADGYQALDYLRTSLPDLIFLDITMPGIDGYQVCKCIKSDARLSAIPVVMLSGKDGFFDRIRGRMVGSTKYITKPFNGAALVQAAEKYCAKSPKNSRVN